MKSRLWIIRLTLVSIFVVAIVILFRARPFGPKPEAEVSTSAQGNRVGMAERGSNAALRPSLPMRDRSTSPQASPWTAAKTDPEKREEMFKGFIEGQNVPVVFYGRVVDQNDDPIPGGPGQPKRAPMEGVAWNGIHGAIHSISEKNGRRWAL